MSDDIQQLLAAREEALLGELQQVRAARAALGHAVAAPKAPKVKGIPKVAMTATADDDATEGSLPAPKRSMSAKARKNLSIRMKARWAAAKKAQKASL